VAKRKRPPGAGALGEWLEQSERLRGGLKRYLQAHPPPEGLIPLPAERAQREEFRQLLARPSPFDLRFHRKQERGKPAPRKDKRGGRREGAGRHRGVTDAQIEEAVKAYCATENRLSAEQLLRKLRSQGRASGWSKDKLLEYVINPLLGKPGRRKIKEI
jgi:hypothetical protein